MKAFLAPRTRSFYEMDVNFQQNRFPVVKGVGLTLVLYANSLLDVTDTISW